MTSAKTMSFTDPARIGLRACKLQVLRFDRFRHFSGLNGQS